MGMARQHDQTKCATGAHRDVHHRFGPEIVVDCNILRDHCNRDCNRLYDNVCSYQKHNHSITHSVTTMASHNLQALCIVCNFSQGYKARKANSECNRLLTSSKHQYSRISLYSTCCSDPSANVAHMNDDVIRYIFNNYLRVHRTLHRLHRSSGGMGDMQAHKGRGG